MNVIHSHVRTTGPVSTVWGRIPVIVVKDGKTKTAKKVCKLNPADQLITNINNIVFSFAKNTM